jgi:hypothetical protein
MGYNITIGELDVFYDQEDSYIGLTAKVVEEENAPDHCKYTGKGNSRSPSYTAWSVFCEEAKISELFYGQGWSSEFRQYLNCGEDFHREVPLLRDHPGAQPITQKDLNYIQYKLKNYQETNPNAVPGFWEEYNVDNGKDPVLARLIWLEFWMNWALENCERPVIANS